MCLPGQRWRGGTYVSLCLCVSILYSVCRGGMGEKGAWGRLSCCFHPSDYRARRSGPRLVFVCGCIVLFPLVLILIFL